MVLLYKVVWACFGWRGAAWRLINCLKWCPFHSGLILQVWKWKNLKGAYQTSVAGSSSPLGATVAAISITHPNLRRNLLWLSCILGNVGIRFGQGIWVRGIIEKRIFLVLPHWILSFSIISLAVLRRPLQISSSSIYIIILKSSIFLFTPHIFGILLKLNLFLPFCWKEMLLADNTFLIG